MKINGVVLRNLESMADTLRHLRTLGEVTSHQLQEDFFLKKGIERALQVCVEAVIDVAHRIISLEGHPPCSTAGKALETLAALGVIKSAEAYKPMVQFRNIAVHRHETVDDNVLVNILRGHLDDFDEFMQEVRRYAASQS